MTKKNKFINWYRKKVNEEYNSIIEGPEQIKKEYIESNIKIFKFALKFTQKFILNYFKLMFLLNMIIYLITLLLFSTIEETKEKTEDFFLIRFMSGDNSVDFINEIYNFLIFKEYIDFSANLILPIVVSVVCLIDFFLYLKNKNLFFLNIFDKFVSKIVTVNRVVILILFLLTTLYLKMFISISNSEFAYIIYFSLVISVRIFYVLLSKKLKNKNIELDLNIFALILFFTVNWILFKNEINDYTILYIQSLKEALLTYIMIETVYKIYKQKK